MLRPRPNTLSMPIGLIVAAGLYLSACSTDSGSTAPDPAADLATRIANAHGQEAWSQQDVVRARVQIEFGGNEVVDGVFTFETTGTRVRHDRADGATILFDGETAWIDSPDAPRGQERFHLLTWPWFVAAPFRMQSGVDDLSDRAPRPLAGTSYDSLRQTFVASAGDSPDDWYLMYTRLVEGEPVLDSMGYIVTYGKDVASAKPSVIRYRDYAEIDGTRLSTRYELWYYDPTTGELIGDAPKATGTVTDIEYLPLDESWFDVPGGALELKAPR